MIYNSKAESYRLQLLLDSARSASRQCNEPSCTEAAIGSHLLQRNGILNLISENNRIIQFSPPSHFHPLRFEEKGLKQANSMFIFPGFCHSHDDSIFNEIENKSCEYYKDKECLLLAYRGLVNEMHKQEYLIDYHNNILQDIHISQKKKSEFIPIRTNMMQRLIGSIRLKALIEKELNKASNPPYFKFMRFELSNLEVATSAIHYFYTAPDVPYEELLNFDYTNWPYSQEVEATFINIIPKEGKTLFILGLSSNTRIVDGYYDINLIPNFNEKQLIKFISDLLMLGTETWFLSPALHTTWLARGMTKKILSLKEIGFQYKEETQNLYPIALMPFNMFI